MTAKSDYLENAWLQLLFNAVAIANIADNAASGPLTNLYVSLHTADPGEAGDQSTSECAYGSYARVAVARTTGGWTVTANAVTNAAAVTFPSATSGSETATHVGIGTAASGAGKLLYRGGLSVPLAISTSVTPEFLAGKLTATEG